MFSVPKLEISVEKLFVPGEVKAKSRIGVFKEYLKSKNEILVTKENIRNFLLSKKEQGCSGAYISDLKRILKKAIELHLERLDLIATHFHDWDYFFKRLKIKIEQPIYSTYSVPSKQQIYDMVDGIENARYQLLFAAMFYLGARPKEFREILLTDIMPQKLISGGVEYAVLMIRSYKTKQQRLNKIPQILLDDIIKVFKSREFLFENTLGGQYSADRLSQIVRSVVKKLQIKYPITPRLFRHYSATEYYSITQDADSGARRLGHSIPVHRKTYVHDKSIDKSEVLHFDYPELRKRIFREAV